jgi:hypothetical protein
MSTTDDLPRDPSAWRPSIHFGARFDDRYEDRRPPRHLDGEIVAGCIERGDVVEGDPDPDVVWLEETFGGVRYRLVVNRADGEVITGYPVHVDETVAADAPRWTPDELADLREFITTDPRNDP